VLAYRDAILAGKGDIDAGYRIVLAHGEVRYVRSSATLERDAQGEPAQVIGTCQDVTEKELHRAALARVNSQLEARVVRRTAELESTVRELEAFSYTVAHDLRAPLRAIDGFSSHLAHSLAEPPSTPSSALLTKIRRNVGSMDRLIDGLLNYARLGRQSLQAAPVDMAALARAARQELAAAHPAVLVEIGELPGAQGDPEVLRQVWVNLLDNACKFSRDRDEPRVVAGANVDASGCVYFVRDNGIGFDTRYQNRLFRVFERLHTDPSFGGAGVGLAIVQRIVHRHGGRVWAESSPEGSTFYFSLGRAPKD
jgi:light-regulated signal transduction histidine kinase (bacteriophytochrome)